MDERGRQGRLVSQDGRRLWPKPTVGSEMESPESRHWRLAFSSNGVAPMCRRRSSCRIDAELAMPASALDITIDE